MGPASPSSLRPLRRLAWGAAAVALAAGGLVSAQPAPVPPTPATPPVALPPQEPPAAEEAPPAVVAPLAPAPLPPIEPEAIQPAPAARAEPEVKAPEVVIKRARYDVAVLQALDKVTAQTVRFEAAVGRPVRYKSLVFTVKACERSTGDEAVEDSIAYLTVDSQPKAAPGKPTPPARQAFKGWMYASSPGLNPLEHPIYDAWLITCRAAAPS